MTHLKMLDLAAVAAMALLAIGVSSASATTYETNGVKNTTDVSILASAEGSIKWERTDGTFLNTCTLSNVVANDNTKTTGTTVEGPITSMTYGTCVTEKVVVDAPGTFSVENISGTTNGTVRSTGTKVTVPSPLSLLTCVTGAGTDIGTFTGKASGNATIDIKAVLNCGFLAPSVIWEGAYTVTSPAGLGVTS